MNTDNNNIFKLYLESMDAPDVKVNHNNELYADIKSAYSVSSSLNDELRRAISKQKHSVDLLLRDKSLESGYRFWLNRQGLEDHLWGFKEYSRMHNRYDIETVVEKMKLNCDHLYNNRIHSKTAKAVMDSWLCVELLLAADIFIKQYNIDSNDTVFLETKQKILNFIASQNLKDLKTVFK